MEHPITPSQELVDKLRDETRHLMFSNAVEREVNLIRAAYQAGADQELEACCEYISKWFINPVYRLNELRSVRRPKPPSLNKQAIDALEASLRNGYIKAEDGMIILRALESIPDPQD